MEKYKPTIGLEIHAELKTRTKMFCRSKNDPFAAEANTHVCPVCMAHPGTLPVINKEAVKHVLRVGEAIGGTPADYTEFDRKNYFYPDLPKGYQISQYEFPLVSGGLLSGIELTRIHLEEDTASSIHDEKTGATLIDYNRAGVPLLELVTEPVIHSAEEAGQFARELQLLLRYLGASDANMEKGEMRVEANISVSQTNELGTKVEIKNLNSFRVMEKAVAYEIERQIKLLEEGGSVIQETRGWDDKKQCTFAQRVKEGSADYRYFPDPDLPSLQVSQITDLASEKLKMSLPELPWERRQRYLDLGINIDDANMYVRENNLGSFFDAVASELNSNDEIKKASNYIVTDLAKLIRDTDEGDANIQAEISISASNFATLVSFAHEGKISSRGVKDILADMVKTNRDPETIANERGLFQSLSVEDAVPVAEKVILSNPEAVNEYRSGKETALQFLIGQGMKESKGSANPKLLSDAIVKLLG